jgi:hypothetical protein
MTSAGYRVEQGLLIGNTSVLFLLTAWQIYSENSKSNNSKALRPNSNNIKNDIHNSSHNITHGKVKLILHRLNLLGVILNILRAVDPSGIYNIYDKPAIYVFLSINNSIILVTSLFAYIYYTAESIYRIQNNLKANEKLMNWLFGIAFILTLTACSLGNIIQIVVEVTSNLDLMNIYSYNLLVVMFIQLILINVTITKLRSVVITQQSAVNQHKENQIQKINQTSNILMNKHELQGALRRISIVSPSGNVGSEAVLGNKYAPNVRTYTRRKSVQLPGQTKEESTKAAESAQKDCEAKLIIDRSSVLNFLGKRYNNEFNQPQLHKIAPMRSSDRIKSMEQAHTSSSEQVTANDPINANPQRSNDTLQSEDICSLNNPTAAIEIRDEVQQQGDIRPAINVIDLSSNKQSEAPANNNSIDLTPHPVLAVTPRSTIKITKLTPLVNNNLKLPDLDVAVVQQHNRRHTSLNINPNLTSFPPFSTTSTPSANNLSPLNNSALADSLPAPGLISCHSSENAANRSTPLPSSHDPDAIPIRNISTEKPTENSTEQAKAAIISSQNSTVSSESNIPIADYKHKSNDTDPVSTDPPGSKTKRLPAAAAVSASPQVDILSQLGFARMSLIRRNHRFKARRKKKSQPGLDQIRSGLPRSLKVQIFSSLILLTSIIASIANAVSKSGHSTVLQADSYSFTSIPATLIVQTLALYLCIWFAWIPLIRPTCQREIEDSAEQSKSALFEHQASFKKRGTATVKPTFVNNIHTTGSAFDSRTLAAMSNRGAAVQNKTLISPKQSNSPQRLPLPQHISNDKAVNHNVNPISAILEEAQHTILSTELNEINKNVMNDNITTVDNQRLHSVPSRPSSSNRIHHSSLSNNLNDKQLAQQIEENEEYESGEEGDAYSDEEEEPADGEGINNFSPIHHLLSRTAQQLEAQGLSAEEIEKQIIITAQQIQQQVESAEEEEEENNSLQAAVQHEITINPPLRPFS